MAQRSRKLTRSKSKSALFKFSKIKSFSAPVFPTAFTEKMRLLESAPALMRMSPLGTGTFWTNTGEFKPFQSDKDIKKPGVFVWLHLTEADILRMLLINFNKNAVFEIFDEKFPDENGRSRLVFFELLYEVLRYSRVNEFSKIKTSALFSIYVMLHNYFRSSLWRTAEETYNYFKECILLHTIERPPRSMEVFQPDEARDILIQFWMIYLRHLPLIQLTSLPNYVVNLKWKPEENEDVHSSKRKQSTEKSIKSETEKGKKENKKKGKKKGKKK